MDPLPTLVASLLSWLHGLDGPDVCPGGWAWSTTALGVLVGLVPTAGVVTVAVIRRKHGARYTMRTAAAVVGVAVVSAGLVPFAVFGATGTVFERVAAGSPVPGLSSAEIADLNSPSCLLESQAGYLGGVTTADAFDPVSPLWFAFALFVLVPLPVLTALFVMAQARTALRRGSRWPSRFFWLPVLVVAFATGPMPAGSTGQLWIGVALGSFLGMFVVPFIGAPSRAPQPAPAVRKRPAALPPKAKPAPARRLPAAPPPLAGTPGPVPIPRQTRREYLPTRVAASPEPRFRVVRRLGAGGFGRVWLAADGKLGTLVALKAAHVPDTETEQRIRREARALGTIRHPNCVRIHDLLDASSDRGLVELSGLVIVMDFVDGPSLGEIVLQRGVLDDRAAARIWAGVSGALAAAHERGVLHRDVKPGNVIVDRAGLPHLIDFGIARSRGDATLTASGFVLGTPDFLAPEVARGQPANPSSDAWQLAATVSFALTGYPPRGGHADALSGLRAAATGMPPSHLPVRSAHYKLLCSAMAADPRQRPSLAAVRSSLEKWLRRAGEPVDGPVAALTGSSG